MTSLTRFPEDITGESPTNLVENELHTLTVVNNAPYRAFVPREGAFFGNSSFIITDVATGFPIAINTQYKFVHIDQEATIRVGDSIYYAVLITDSNVSNNIKIEYQCLGGSYGLSNDAIADAYENIIENTTPVSWVDVLAKPDGYPPTLHNNLLSDIYGFQPIIGAIERLSQAVTLGQVPTVQALLDYSQWRWGSVENLPTTSDAEVVAGVGVHKYVTFDALVKYSTRYETGGVAQIESERAIAAETLLQNNINSLRDTLNAALANETTNRTNADNGLQSSINSVSNGLASEITNRTNANSTLSNAINAEKNRAQTAEGSLQSAIDTINNTFRVNGNFVQAKVNGVWVQIYPAVYS